MLSLEKIKIKCNREYGNSHKEWSDNSFFNSRLISELISKYEKDGCLGITEKFVDEYNNGVTTPYSISFKTAGNIAKYIKKIMNKG